MALGKHKLLAAFLEKDNLKLLAYDVFGSRATRVFAGQISFSPEVLRDAYIADSAKFSGQLKIAFTQKDLLGQVDQVVLFIPPDKTFTKSLPVTDTIDGFVQSLPYFKEELLLSTENIGGKHGSDKITHVAFEKKLIEDFQRAFLESSKEVAATKSSVNVLGANFVQDGQYFLLVPFEKEIALAVVDSGAVLEMAAFAKEVFLTRFGEYIINHDLGKINQAYTVGVFDAQVASEIRSKRGLEVSALETNDVYDVVVTTYLRSSAGGMVNNLLGKINWTRLGDKIPNRKYLFLGLAAIVGVILVMLLFKNIGKKPEVASPVVTAPTPPPAPEAKPGDFKVRVLNGTLVEGEGGRLGDKLKGLGFDVVETKNATTAGFVATRLRAAPGVPDKIVSMVKSSLTDYETINLEPLASDSAGVKIEVIVGKKK